MFVLNVQSLAAVTFKVPIVVKYGDIGIQIYISKYSTQSIITDHQAQSI